MTAALNEVDFHEIRVIGGRYGLSSKDTTPADMYAVFQHLAREGHNHFTVGITDDVTHLSIEPALFPHARGPQPDLREVLGHRVRRGWWAPPRTPPRSSGTTRTKYVQAYFQYDSKKSGGLTISHLRFGDHPIRSAYYVGDADCVVCGNPSYVDKYDMVGDVKPGGVFLLNCGWSEEDLERRLPADMKRTLAQKGIHLYLCDAVTIAREIGLKGRINTIIQSAYFKLAGILPAEEAIEYMKQGIVNDYAAKGQKIVDMNVAAVLAGQTAAREVAVPEHWAHLEGGAPGRRGPHRGQRRPGRLCPEHPPAHQPDGGGFPCRSPPSCPMPPGRCPRAPLPLRSGASPWRSPSGTWKTASSVTGAPRCAPHAVIRPFLLKPEDAKGLDTVPSKTDPSRRFLIAVSAEDCVDCGSCAEMCPARVKALTMEKAEDRMHQDQMVFHYAKARGVQKGSDGSVRESQFLRPYLEYSGACPGCGDPYAKLVTQLFGDRAVIANATGCSSIWGASVPSMPYVVDETGKGPAWANSLFEDNAEFGYGMAISLRTRRAALKIVVERMAKNPAFAGIAKSLAGADGHPGGRAPGPVPGGPVQGLSRGC